MLREKLVGYERQKGIVHADVTFSDYVRFWLNYIARSVDDITLQGYQVLADKHILPYFDELNVAFSNN